MLKSSLKISQKCAKRNWYADIFHNFQEAQLPSLHCWVAQVLGGWEPADYRLRKGQRKDVSLTEEKGREKSRNGCLRDNAAQVETICIATLKSTLFLPFDGETTPLLPIDMDSYIETLWKHDLLTELLAYAPMSLPNNGSKIRAHSKYDTCHTVLQPFSEFRLEYLTPLLQEVHMDPIWLEFEVGLLLVLGPPEMGALGTPKRSHGTNFLVSKIFFYHENMMLFYAFLTFIRWNSDFI